MHSTHDNRGRLLRGWNLPHTGSQYYCNPLNDLLHPVTLLYSVLVIIVGGFSEIGIGVLPVVNTTVTDSPISATRSHCFAAVHMIIVGGFSEVGIGVLLKVNPTLTDSSISSIRSHCFAESWYPRTAHAVRKTQLKCSQTTLKEQKSFMLAQPSLRLV